MVVRPKRAVKSKPSPHGSRLEARKRLVTDPVTSARLARIRQRDTRPELVVRKHLFAAGLRYRVLNRDLPGSPDIANRERRWAIFVHGCFWHHHAGCSRATVPKRNHRFWLDKFEANRARDRRAVLLLRKMGFQVFSIWECDTRHVHKVESAIARFLIAIRRRPPGQSVDVTSSSAPIRRSATRPRRPIAS